MKIGRTYSFEAAHWIPTVPEGHKCLKVHGHSYRVEVVLSGEIGASGMIVEFGELDKVVDPIIEEIDHTTLNNFIPLDCPTAEVIATYLLGRLPEPVSSVKVWENDRSWALAER